VFYVYEMIYCYLCLICNPGFIRTEPKQASCSDSIFKVDNDCLEDEHKSSVVVQNGEIILR